MASGIPGGVIRSGSASVTDGGADETVIGAPGADKKLRLLKGIITITVAAIGGGGEVALEDGVGGSNIIRANADTIKEIPFDFGPRGLPLTANTLLNVTVDSAVTTEASASVSAVAFEVG